MGRNCIFFFFSSRRRHTRSDRDWSSDVCSSELRIATLDQLLKRRRRQPRWHGIVRGWRELAGIAGQRLPLALVVRGYVHHERRRRRVIDEVITDPLGAPGRLARLVTSKAASE